MIEQNGPINPFTVDASWYDSYWLADEKKQVADGVVVHRYSPKLKIAGFCACTMAVVGGAVLGHFGLGF